MNVEQSHISLLEDFQRRHTSGLATLVFTDLAGSTKLKNELGDARAGALLHKHHAVVRSILATFPAAREISTAGDSFFIVFDSPSNAVLFSLKLHSELRALSKAVGRRIEDRIGIHVGEVFVEHGSTGGRVQNLTGIHVDTCARVMSVCDPQRTLLTRFAFENAKQVLTGQSIPSLGPLHWVSHGLFELKGVSQPLEICEVCERGKATPAPLRDGEKAKRFTPAPITGITEGRVPAAKGANGAARRHWREAASLFAVGLAVAFLTVLSPLGRVFEGLSYDFAYWFRPKVAPGEAVILYMDEASHNEEEGRPPFKPWDHKHHAQMIERLSRAGAKAIVFDILFEKEQAGSSALLIEAARKAGNVFLAAYETVRDQGEFRSIQIHQPFEALKLVRQQSVGIVEASPKGEIAREHYRVLGGHDVKPLAELVARFAESKTDLPSRQRWLNFYGPPQTISGKSYIHALDPAQVPDEYFAGKLVFIGAGAEPPVAFSGGAGTNSYIRAYDQFPTPYSPKRYGNAAGVEINATACLNLLRGDTLHQWSPSSEIAFFIFCALLAAALAIFLPPVWSLSAGVLLALILAISSSILVWQTNRWGTWAVASLAEIPAVLICGIALRAERLRRQKQSLEQALITQHTEFMTKASLLSQRATLDADATALDPDAQVPAVPDFEVLSSVGKGAYGEVWLARDLTGSYRAVKVVRSNNFRSSRPFDREFDGLRRFAPLSRSHPGLVDILHVGRNQEGGFFYYVMEAADDARSGRAIDPAKYRPMTLSSLLGERRTLEPPEVVALGVRLGEALECIHQNGLLHRDMKPANVLFVNGGPQLADPGLVTLASEDGSAISMVGTPGYMAPDAAASPRSDLYSLGKVLYQTAMGLPVEAFPELPTAFLASPDHAFYLELNQLILKACANAPEQRHATLAEFCFELRSLGKKSACPPPETVRFMTTAARP